MQGKKTSKTLASNPEKFARNVKELIIKCQVSIQGMYLRWQTMDWWLMNFLYFPPHFWCHFTCRSCWNQTCKQQNWISGLQASVYYNWLQAKHLFLQAAVNSRALSFLLETRVQLYIWTPHHQYMNEYIQKRLTWWVLPVWFTWKDWHDDFDLSKSHGTMWKEGMHAMFFECDWQFQKWGNASAELWRISQNCEVPVTCTSLPQYMVANTNYLRYFINSLH